ncbi:uncharacterized protein LOC110415700 [Herrania umbratica]|uniref:Uncharacterized protein LOC110415700 n=1 Tax=Herrania umbratica TaxID=108875 RepID=A0A6J1A894_9ROSI|nr:uncharacterized protein LOC110415700 [Herrania umbratica]XP_021283071.1 uncharacterized protein LOC110415700 [Herrania umbratica]
MSISCGNTQITVDLFSSNGSPSRREKQKCPTYSSSNGMKIEKRPAGEEIIAQSKRSTSLPNSGSKKAKKSLKRMKVEVAEKKGETRLMMELLKEEAKAKGISVEKIQTDIERMKRENVLNLEKDECTRLFINHMLVIFVAEDNVLMLD